MKILMINGTMRKSSTYRIGRMFVERVALPGDTVNELFLPKDMPEFCRGCGSCIRHGESNCPDYVVYMRRITRMIDEADLLVFTTPTYVLHASGQMKALLDHYGYRWMVHRPEESMFRKQAVIFSTAAGTGMKSAMKDIKDSLDFWGVGKIYTYGIAVRSMNWDDVAKEIKDVIDQKLYRLMDQIKRDPEKVKLSRKTKILFAIMRYVQRKKQSLDTDYEYWKEKGWLDDVRPWKNNKKADSVQ